MTDTLSWEFPLPRTHTGMLLGNGRTGLIVWGGGSTLCVTIGRADLWDHRGGMPWTDRQNYAAIRRALEAGDEQAIKDIFRPPTEGVPGEPARPTVLPLGRLEVELEPGCTLERGELDLRRGTARARFGRPSLSDGTSIEGLVEVGLYPHLDVAWIRVIGSSAAIRGVTSRDIMGERLGSLSFAAPERFSGPGPGGWHWPLPADPGVVVGWTEAAPGLTLLAVGRTESGSTTETARAQVSEMLGAQPVPRLEEEALGYWERFWRRAPAVRLPNRTLQELHDYGLYCFAGLTNPAGTAATLQGPWIEEYDFPPWSSDYHFNINVQMCYSPAYRAGLFDHLRPLFDLVWSWREKLEHNARAFIGADGYMLPHAVDDRCTCMGSFWTGTIDHACTAWVARMMYEYADYAGDLTFLRDRAFPFMRGAFAVYRRMLEPDGERLRLPVSVSPEYRGAAMDAWGANASFQLAAIHRLAADLAAAARMLGIDADPEWDEVRRRLPQACVGGEEPRILLWEGVDLEESHRHHSHLAAITPFGTIDPLDPGWREVVERSIRHWVARGMGYWSGWCMPWASAIHSHLGNGEGAELLLELWNRVFTNEGRGSMHDAVSNGLTLMGAPPLFADGSGPPVERMQMDGRMGAVAAVQDMLLHTRAGVLRVFAGVPRSWKECSFTGMRAPGGLVVTARLGREAWQIELTATRDTAARIEPPGPLVGAARNGRKIPAGGGIVSVDLATGDRLVLEGRRSAGSGR